MTAEEITAYLVPESDYLLAMKAISARIDTFGSVRQPGCIPLFLIYCTQLAMFYPIAEIDH